MSHTTSIRSKSSRVKWYQSIGFEMAEFPTPDVFDQTQKKKTTRGASKDIVASFEARLEKI